MNGRYLVAGLASIGSVIFAAFVIDFDSTSSTAILAGLPIVVFVATMMVMGVDNPYSYEKRYAAKLQSIHDGDTVKLDFHGRVEAYRIQYIDTPELDQEDGEACAAMLGALLRFKYLEFSLPSTGSTMTYDRTVCVLYGNGKNIGLEMVKRGYAWVDVRYETPPEYITAFADAVRNRKGIFKDGYPVHPELHRDRKKKAKLREQVEKQAAEIQGKRTRKIAMMDEME